jgi:hypothetical protein
LSDLKIIEKLFFNSKKNEYFIKPYDMVERSIVFLKSRSPINLDFFKSVDTIYENMIVFFNNKEKSKQILRSVTKDFTEKKRNYNLKLIIEDY